MISDCYSPDGSLASALVAKDWLERNGLTQNLAVIAQRRVRGKLDTTRLEIADLPTDFPMHDGENHES